MLCLESVLRDELLIRTRIEKNNLSITMNNSIDMVNIIYEIINLTCFSFC